MIAPSRRCWPVVDLAGHQPEVAHQLLGALEALEVADLGAQTGGAERGDPAQAAQPAGLQRPRRSGQHERDLPLQAGAAMAERVDGPDHVFERRLGCDRSQPDRGEPAAVVARPRVPGPLEAHAAAQQVHAQPGAAAHQVHAHRLACTHQIAQRLLLDVGNPDRVQLARPQQPHQELGVAPIGLDAIARRARNLARRRDHAVNATARKLGANAYPVGPASYAARTGRGNPAHNPAACPISPPNVKNCSSPVSASSTAATILLACTSRPTRLLAFATAGSSSAIVGRRG